ncbi:MAG: TPM domain-containing protein [Pseudomonadales bacterium]|nr:TPM domain-containing protein [Pseudomonadales bacterium]
MTLLTESELEKVSAAIHEVEQKTDAELVTVLAARADNYSYIPTMWAAMLALLSPSLVTVLPFWVEMNEIMLIQLGVFIVLAILLRWQPILVRIIPNQVKTWRASNLARRQFLENNLHHTQAEVGVLIFVSEIEHYVEIIADRGVSSHITDAEWAEIVSAMTDQVAAGNTLEGFLSCVDACGVLLEKHLPATSAKDELPNHMVVI